MNVLFASTLQQSFFHAVLQADMLLRTLRVEREALAINTAKIHAPPVPPGGAWKCTLWVRRIRSRQAENSSSLYSSQPPVTVACGCGKWGL